ncbi:MAG: hypothetical protein JWO63_2209 [Frankiales bacterium]|jgi:hypothetical protein|nr:hypothetical protein [Frankiales bacterium]
MALPAPLNRIVAFLRAGYPDGVPERDYVPLFALLARQLSEDEVRQVATELAAFEGEASAPLIRSAITEVTHEHASDHDIARVSAKLAAAGWPLASAREPS